MLTVDHLLRVIDAFRAKREVSNARVSAFLFNDGKRVRLLREGGDVGSRHLASALRWLSDNWPEGAEWPEGIDRPECASIRSASGEAVSLGVSA